MGSEPKSAAEWLDAFLAADPNDPLAYITRQERMMAAMLRDAKAELDTLHSLLPPTECTCKQCVGRGWAAIEAKWREGKYR